jgi:hypothetical protein
MDQEPELTREQITAIDACRPDSDDGNFPEVASVLASERSARIAEYRSSAERFDRAVRDAIEQVALPEGLAERILVRLGQNDLVAKPGNGAASVELANSTLLAQPIARRRLSRRTIAGAVAMAASLLVAVAFWTSRQTIDATDVQAQAIAFYENDDHSADLSDVASSIVLPIAGNTVLGSRTVTFLKRSGTAYELGRSLRGRAVKGTLYVVPLKSLWGPTLSGLPTMPSPQGSSGVTVAVWRDDTNVYVMVVNGDHAAFMSFFSQKLA